MKATAESFFGLFAGPIVAKKTSRSDFRIADLMCGPRPVSVYLQPPPSDGARLTPLMRLMLNQIARGLMEDQIHAADGRVKRHRVLLCLDGFPQLGRLPFFETAMGAMAGYGLKAYLVCQSLNHITRAYGRDNVIFDNCHVIMAFAAADMETARRIGEMAGEVWEVRPQESEARPRALMGPRRGSVVYREERRPLLLPGDVRQLGREDQLVFVSGCKPLKTRKLRFDQEPALRARLRPADRAQVALSGGHDWEDAAPFGVTPLEPGPRGRPGGPASARPADEPGDLFAPAEGVTAPLSQRPGLGLDRPADAVRPSGDPAAHKPRSWAARRTGV